MYLILIDILRERIDEVLSGERDINSKKFDALATAAVVYELYKRDPTYFDFVKPGNVADVAVETFDYLLNQGKAREVYRRFRRVPRETFEPSSRVPENRRVLGQVFVQALKGVHKERTRAMERISNSKWGYDN